MRWRLLILVVCVGSILSLLPAEVLDSKVSVPERLIEQPPVQLSVEQLHNLAESITVKVISGEVLGSGIIIRKQGSIYTVLTNDHVLRSGDPPYKIQTADSRVHAADLPQAVSFNGNDLALLQFRSANPNYSVASSGTSPTVGDEVFAAGFPFVEEPSHPSNRPNPFIPGESKKGFVFRTGKVSLVLDKALEGGYRIGYTNYIEKGMSGGPLLNHRGDVVSINGMHAEPLWGDPYVYMDGSEPEQTLKEQMSRYSWGIPIETYVQLAPKKMSTEL